MVMCSPVNSMVDQPTYSPGFREHITFSSWLSNGTQHRYQNRTKPGCMNILAGRNADQDWSGWVRIKSPRRFFLMPPKQATADLAYFPDAPMQKAPLKTSRYERYSVLPCPTSHRHSQEHIQPTVVEDETTKRMTLICRHRPRRRDHPRLPLRHATAHQTSVSCMLKQPGIWCSNLVSIIA